MRANRMSCVARVIIGAMVSIAGATSTGCSDGGAPSENTQQGAHAVESEGWLTGLYSDVLGRAPDDDGLAFWEGQLDAGATPAQVAASFVDSDEAQRLLVNLNYGFLLRRGADPDGFAWHLSRVKAGVPNEQETATFLSSDEYFDIQAGGTTEGYVTKLYEDALGRDGSPDEVAAWAGSGLSRYDIAMGFTTSVEYRSRLVTFYYQYYLHRAPESAGFEFHLGHLEAGWTQQRVQADFLSSGEYQSNHGGVVDTPDSPPPTGCNGISEEGICQGNTAVWCDADTQSLGSDDCGSSGATCVDGYCDGGDSQPDDTGTPVPCGSVTDDGQCSGALLSYCLDGSLESYDCSEDGLGCGDTGGGVMDCQ